MNISQVEFNIQVSAALEQTGKEINKTKASLASTGSSIDTAHMTIGDIGQLMLSSGYGYKISLNSSNNIVLPQNVLMDIDRRITGLKICNERAAVVTKLEDAFVMVYDSRQAEIVTCYLAQSQYNDSKESFMLYYRGMFNSDRSGIDKTSLWLVNKNKNNQGLSYPQWPYIYAAKTAFFPFGAMDKEQGIYGPYEVSDYSYGVWGLSGKRTIAQILKEMQAQSLMSSVPQTFSPEELSLLWSNIHIGQPDLNFVEIFQHTLSTGLTPYTDNRTVIN